MKTAATAIAAALAAAAAHGAGIDAEYVSTSVRTLADGNTVEHEFTGRFALDDEGRTRVEIQGRVDIMDPVAGVRWSANSAGQAFRFEMPGVPDGEIEPPSGVSVTRVGDEDRVPEVPELPEIGEPDMTDLGPAIVNGLETTGMLLRHTVPAGVLGNTGPVVIETTVWRTDEYGFGLPVKTVVDDPFSGRSVQEIRNIRPLEPGEGESLFRPDPVWTVVDAPAQMMPGALETIGALPAR